MSVPPVTLSGRATPSPVVMSLGLGSLSCDTPSAPTFPILNRSFDRTCPWPERDEDVHPRVIACRCMSACRATTERSTKRKQRQLACHWATTSQCSWRSRMSSRSRRTSAERTQASPSSPYLPERPLDSEKPPESLAARGALRSSAHREELTERLHALMTLPNPDSGFMQLRLRVSSVLRLPRSGEGVR